MPQIFLTRPSVFDLFVPFEVILDRPGEGTGKDDHGAMADAVGQKQWNAVDQAGGRLGQDNGQDRRHVGEGAGAQRQAENEPQEESGPNAFAAGLGISGSGQLQLDDAQQIKPDQHENAGHQVIAPAADVAQHAAQERGHDPDQANGGQDPQGESQRNAESLARW